MPPQTDLEKRVEALMATIERERAERLQERDAAAARIQELEIKLKTVSKPSSPVKPINTRAASPNTKRSPSPNAEPKSQPAPSSAAPVSRFSRKPAAAAAEKKPQEKPVVDTAAQHAWDKFCVMARKEFTVRDLSLVSQATLHDLLRHYNLNDPVECAQIECQWALLQEGKTAVDEPTIRKPRSGRAQPFKPVEHKQEFNLRQGPMDPSLSKRVLLNPEDCRESDPNASTLRRRSVSPGSKGAIHIDPLTGCNPNDSQSPGRALRGKRTWQDPPTSIYRDDRRAQGKGRAHSPQPEQILAYPQRDAPKDGGVKRFVRHESPESRQRGLKVGYAAPSEGRRPGSLRVKHSGGGPVNFNL